MNTPAFPVTEQNGSNTGESGMTLRDYFAAKSLAALISGSMADGTCLGANSEHVFAKAAYLFADAMLEARSA